MGADAAMLRAREKTRAHLSCLGAGLRARFRPIVAGSRTEPSASWLGLRRRRHRKRAQGSRLLAHRTTSVNAKLAGRRSTSRRPGLLNYVLTRPIVSAGMIAAGLGVTTRAETMVVELEIREAIGRARYRASGAI